AQTGFLDGPRTLSAMSADEWVPKRFKNLSERLVTQNGVLSMGIAAAAVLYYTRGAVALLVVMYSTNVFLTFTLSQLGMARHWLQVRKESAHWRRRFIVNTVGAVVTAVILVMTTTLKFSEGGWRHVSPFFPGLGPPVAPTLPLCTAGPGHDTCSQWTSR